MGSTAWWMKVGVEDEEVIRKGPWTLEEDTQLVAYVRQYGAARWSSLAKMAGLKRDGKSCRMRWLNYLRPELKHGNFSPEEDRLIIELHNKWGNKWSSIAQNLPGRTDNEIKNHWRTHIMKMSPELIGSCPPTSKSPKQTKSVRENDKLSSSESFEDLQMAAMKESYTESYSPNTLNQASCDTCDSDCSYQEFIEKSCDMDIVGSIIADEYAAMMVQESPTFSWSSGTDSPISVLSDSEEFLWDYNSIDLWNLDDVQSMYC
ncbi:hypothetical protein SUGI_0037080 [Cryptomeria japonica]|uniref:MYB-like transcription factor EOBI n=1 Tax=Cryptomeria japonica TaxID=3369 RepID=UPI002408E84F|nr:MYB-like transcription factor EOBI [Cryptomeria japonica]GLJ06358.1 hypothetical protein SUGI_0037080 [Cryptomeria japonica]